MADPATHGERVRAAEVIAAVCLATDLGEGFPFEHGLHGTLAAMRLCERLGVDSETASQTYYASLLAYAGCTADAEVAAEIFGAEMAPHLVPVLYGSQREAMLGMLRALPEPGGSPPRRALQTARRLPRAARAHRPHLEAQCEVAEMLAQRLGLPPGVSSLFGHLTERWDGRGRLGRARGDEIPPAIRIAQVARDATYQQLLGGPALARRVVAGRAGRAFDPEIAALLAAEADEILAFESEVSAWQPALDLEPQPGPWLEGEQIDRALAAVGDFADLSCPFFSGHSSGVAALASAAAERCPLEPADRVAVRRAALLHDVGRVAVAARTWQKPGPLSADEWEQVRLHPYHTERVLSRSPLLASLAPIAAAHHERLDGSGYHRGAAGAELPVTARLLAVADVYRALLEARPHRPALAAQQAAAVLGEQARAGRLDPDAVAVVLEAAGQAVPRIERPSGLTERESQVIALLARGLQTKQVAQRLGISAKTADRHIQNAYAKLGISSRAAAALFAMEHGLLAWGELPIARSGTRS